MDIFNLILEDYKLIISVLQLENDFSEIVNKLEESKKLYSDTTIAGKIDFVKFNINDKDLKKIILYLYDCNNSYSKENLREIVKILNKKNIQNNILDILNI